MLTKEEVRELTQKELQNELDIIRDSYMKIYDEYYETYSRDSAFLKDLVDAIKGISAVIEVYTRDGKIHPDYALEKLRFSKYLISTTEDYYKSKLEEPNE